MSSYDEFCQHYELDADAPDSRLQFKQYQTAYQTLMAAVGVIDLEKPTKPNARY